jgi:WD40 repeat protein
LGRLFSPDGKVLASTSKDQTTKLWDVASGKEVRCINGYGTDIDSVAFSPDGKTLAAFCCNKFGHEYNAIKLFDVNSGKELRTLRGHSTVIGSVAFSPDGKILASDSLDKTIRLWDIATGKALQVLTGRDSGAACSVAFSPDGKALASVGQNREVVLWDVATGKKVRALPEASSPESSTKITTLAFSPDGKLVAGAGDHNIKLWNVASGEVVSEFTTESDAEYLGEPLSFTPDGKSLISTGFIMDSKGGVVRNVSVWDVASGKRSSVGDTFKFLTVAVSPNAKVFASVSLFDRSNIRLRDLASGKELRRLIGDSRSLSFKRPPSRHLLKLASAGGVKIGRIKYLAPETKRDLRLERLLRRKFYPDGIPFEDPPVSYLYNKADLNGDGVPELIVMIRGKDCCGSGGCSRLVVQPSKGYKVIGNLGVSHSLPIVSEQKTKGWNDLVEFVFGGGPRYGAIKWNGSRYDNYADMKVGQTVNGSNLEGYESDGISLGPVSKSASDDR